MILEEGSTGSINIIPCDVHECVNRTELIAYKETGSEITMSDEAEGTFIEELIKREPSLGQIFQELPHADEDHQALAELIIDDKLVAGSDGGDNQDDRIVFTVTLASEELTDIHTSSHKIRGGSKDSGRAEMMGIMVIIIYLSHVIEWHGLPQNSAIPI